MVREQATLAGGCFWCLEAVYLELRGVERVVSGYTGGDGDAPTYEQVCTGTTGYAEAVQITFDPAAIAYRDLLDVFFAIHDPTTQDRQGNDVGTQYRSAIFTHSDAQAATAKAVIAELTAAKAFSDPIVTQVVPFARFWPGEAYHQDFFRRNPRQPYCVFVVAPKVAKARKQFLAKLKSP
jgi:peptide-methionine (S)-S-oxide reductase